MKNINVRQAVIDDAPTLFDLILQSSYETDFLALSPAERINEGFSKEKIENLLKNESTIMFICFFNDLPIGNLGIHFTKRERFKHRASIGMNVIKDYWGIGAGTSLLTKALEYFLSDKNLTKLELEVRADNVRAINLYKKFDFKIEGNISKFFRINDQYYSAYIMGLEK